jgi:hypothetical protein
MIGGNDIVIPAVGDPTTLEACVRIVHRHWPDARFEDAVTGDKYNRYEEIPLGRVREVLAYPDADAEALWDADSPDSPLNSILYLIMSPNFITVVLDDPTTAEMHSILESIRGILWMDILNTYSEAA